MSKVISSKDLSKLDDLIIELKKLSFSLRLLSEYEFDSVSWDGFSNFNEWKSLFDSDIKALSSVAQNFDMLDDSIRNPILQNDKLTVSVDDMLSSADAIEFANYCKDCLSCDYHSMSESEKLTAFASWQKSISSDDSASYSV